MPRRLKEKPWYKGGSINFLEQDSEAIEKWKDLRSPDYWARKREEENASRNADTSATDGEIAADEAKTSELQKTKSGGNTGTLQASFSSLTGPNAGEENNLNSDHDHPSEVIGVENVETVNDLEADDDMEGAHDRDVDTLAVSRTYQLRRRNKNHGVTNRKLKCNCNCSKVQSNKTLKLLHELQAKVLSLTAEVAKLKEERRTGDSVARYSRSVANGEENAMTIQPRKQRRHPVRGEPYCDICKVYFKHASGKSLHIQAVHYGKTWACQDCGKVYASPGARANHIKSAHRSL